MLKSWKLPAAAAVALFAYPTLHWLQLGDYIDFGLDCLGLGAAGLSFVSVLAGRNRVPAKAEPETTVRVEPAQPVSTGEPPVAAPKPAPDADPEATLYARCVEAQEQFGIRYVHVDGFDRAVVTRVANRLRREGWNVAGDGQENRIEGYEDLGILEIRRQEAVEEEPAETATPAATGEKPAEVPAPAAVTAIQ
jgi:hypothetical protein